jgi:hypothetical protein
MEPIMYMTTAAALLALAAAGCRLDPLVKDKPGASAHLLPASAVVPSAASNPELANQIALNDGVNDKALMTNGGVIPRGTGVSNGKTVRYWSFGAGNRAPSPIYKFYARLETGELQAISHPPLVDALPGDAAYSALHTINQVVVTEAYAGQLITTSAALADAIELGLAEPPVPTGTFVTSPVVLPTTSLDTGAAAPEPAEVVYGHGYSVGAFELGGELGVQPIGELLPTSQVSYLRDATGATYDSTRPVFQATIPTVAATTKANYTPLSVVLDVDLKPSDPATSILSDGQLFMRTSTGAIGGTQGPVELFQVTTTISILQLQFMDGRP